MPSFRRPQAAASVPAIALITAAAALAAPCRPSLADAAQTPPIGLPGATVPKGWGINIHFTDPSAGEMDRFGEAGFGFARMDFIWSGIEKQKGVYDFAPWDRLYNTLARVGTRPLYILDYGNDLYQKGSPTTPEARAAFSRFAVTGAKHFAGKGVVWEIWNEPNGGFWHPAPNAAEYGALAIQTAHDIHAAVPGATVIAPGSATFAWDFLADIFKAGLLREIDGISVHPYRGGPPETAGPDWARLRELIARYAPKGREDLPMISSEWGYTTVNHGTPEDLQAAYLTREWLANTAAGVNLSIFYDWRNDGPDPNNGEHRFGTVQQDLTPKPSFLAAKRLIAGLRGYTFRHRLAGATLDDWKLLFQAGNTGKIAVVTWNADPRASVAQQTPVVRDIALTDADYAGLLRLASVRITMPSGAIVQTPEALGRFTVSVANATAQPATVTATVVPVELGDAKAAASSRPAGAARFSRTAPGKETKPASLTIPDDGMRSEAYAARLSLTWNGQPLPALAPLPVRRTNPLGLFAAPAGKAVRVGIENPGDYRFDGSVALVSAQGKPLATKPVRIDEGADSAQVDLPLPASGAFRVALRDHAGRIVVQTGTVRFAPLTPFPAAPSDASGYQQVRFVENAPQSPAALAAIAAPDGSPSPVAVRFPYQFEKGWRYDELSPATPLAIPPGAKAVSLWVHSDGSGDALRARFRDATGQTFQPDAGGLLTWKGWKLVTIPLDGSRSGHWGGNGGGVPTGPLTWEALLLVDSTNRNQAHGGELLVADPAYAFAD